MNNGQPEPSETTERNYDALRAYLQRGETRLSTLHRVAGVFLGGAGLLTLFPVFFRDAFFEVITAVVTPINPGADHLPVVERVFFGLAAILTIGVAIYALYLLLKDLVLFYFTAHHFGSTEGPLYPRFILSGIRVSNDELNEAGARHLRAARKDPAVLGLLVPEDDESIDAIIAEAAQLNQYIDPREHREPDAQPTDSRGNSRRVRLQIRDFLDVTQVTTYRIARNPKLSRDLPNTLALTG